MADRRSDPAVKQAKRDRMRLRPRDPNTGRILTEKQGAFAAETPPRYTRSSDFDPTPTDALDDDLGAPILSRTSHEVERAQGSSRLRTKQDAPHVDLTPTPALAQFDLAPRPVQAVPLSTKQEHSAEIAATILASIPTTHDHEGVGLSWAESNAMAASFVEMLRLNNPPAARKIASELLVRGRVSRGDLMRYVLKHLV